MAKIVVLHRIDFLDYQDPTFFTKYCHRHCQDLVRRTKHQDGKRHDFGVSSKIRRQYTNESSIFEIAEIDSIRQEFHRQSSAATESIYKDVLDRHFWNKC
ncbi:hypothetical protein CDAR_5641 [Caerostris darwini]|uniref:Uncharacterized protein n=1 Tax=Caerostris darwini TaxID=1538125 RepID=A0AAV4VI94_9ARAC|nr:hypothetical protein CDAR_5641 [Caerostris darwini]